MKLAIVLLLCSVSYAAAGKNWALLFTGARFWANYCVDANLCHAYQVLHKAGVPDERIIVVMYDDIAENEKNPFPGELYNNYNHTDVYKGALKDYTHKEVTIRLVLAVLRGDKAKVKELTGREGKVIDSGPDDNVFVAASGHGSVGLLAFPDGMLTARTLNKALEDMHDNKKFAKLVFYLESCYSGSIFEDLSKDLNIYAMTASDPMHEAWQNYCDDKAFKPVCIGGEFSTGWIESAEIADLSTYTFRQHAEAIKMAVNSSHPQQYGDLSFLDRPLQDFFSNGQKRTKQVSPVQTRPPRRSLNVQDSGVPFHTMELTLLQRQVKARPADVNLRLQLARLQAMMADVDRFFHLAARHVYPVGSSALINRITESKAEPIRNWDCYEQVLDVVNTSCRGLLHHPKLQGYFLSKFSALVNMCNRETGSVAAEAVQAASRQIELCQ